MNEEIYQIKIEDLGLSSRSYNMLKRGGINTVGDLYRRKPDDWMGVRNVGRKSVEEVLEKLKELGFQSEGESDNSKQPGREKCNKLREIRKLIAEVNNIEYKPAECDHTGPCAGTCPVCDEEIQYLDEQLQKKKRAGEEINIGGLVVDIANDFEDNLRNDIDRTSGNMRLPNRSSKDTTGTLTLEERKRR